MTPEVLLEKFGYLAVFVGTFLEGEGILVAAGFFAQRGYLDVFLVTIVAFLGAFFGHLFWFWLGRAHGVRLLDRFPKLKKHFGKGIRLFERYGASAIIISQWLYGIRITAAVIVGFSKISVAKFLFYEGISCLLWAIVITAAGYYFGSAIEAVLGRVEHVEKYGLLLIVVIGIGVWLYHRNKEKAEEEVEPPPVAM
jgi:membrane protein DedA with SNARE-associated domain